MEYLHPYIPILMIVVLAAAFAVVTIIASALIGPHRPGRVKALPYESGMVPFHEANIRLPIKFYVVALLFLLFDVETVLILTWAIAFRAPGAPMPGFQGYAFLVMLFFMIILVIGLLYEWRKGALKWT
ncbi:NADH-quinone oxidoreductase subunit A [bacterium]|nr:NADH-quinone oxidoreductase subunit A [bacterium]